MNMGAYADAGVDYTKIEPFKHAMIETGRKTTTNHRCVGIVFNQDVLHAHGAVYGFVDDLSFWLCQTEEGLGNLNWIAEWMYAQTGKSYYDVIARASALIIANDTVAQGADPFLWEDHVAAGDSEWFADEVRSRDYARGAFEVCTELGMALPAGESSSCRYVVKAEPPVKSAPVMSGSVTGLIRPRSRLVTGHKLQAGDHILACPSTGLHANGVSLVIKKALELPDQFLTRIPGGNTLGEEALIPMRSYAALVQGLLNHEVDVHALLPGTGDGVGKLAFDSRPFTYRIHSWLPVPSLFLFFRDELGVSLEDCLKTFNWGAGYYVFVPAGHIAKAIDAAKKAGYQLMHIGVVEDGERKTVFGPYRNLVLPPPGC